MRRDRIVSRLACVTLAATALAGCSSDAPVAPDDHQPPDVSLSVQAGAAGDGWAATSQHVLLFEDAVPDDLNARISALGGTIVRVHPEIDAAVVDGLDDAGAATLAADADIASATRDLVVQSLPDLNSLAGTQSLPAGGVAGHDPTTAAFFPFQWDMQIIDADDAWNAGYDDASGVRVAILDTGLDPFHIDMAGNIDAAASIAYIPSVAGVGPPWGDDYFHGTHVGGTVVTNGIGTSGVAPHATLIAVKVCDNAGGCSFAAVMSGLVHAASVDADVANMSLGGFVNIPAGSGPLNAALNRAVNYASSHGVLVVSAAGNSAVDLDHIERNFRDFGVRAFRASPCENGNGMCISATGPTDALASYSNYGRSAVSVAAPGGDFNGDVFASTVLSPCSSLGLVCFGSTSTYLFLQGTSMAAPHVSGAAALLDGQFGGGLNAGQLGARLRNSADDLGKKGADPIYGHGRINVGNLLGAN
jgi:subtilisin family serine protease